MKVEKKHFESQTNIMVYSGRKKFTILWVCIFLNKDSAVDIQD